MECLSWALSSGFDLRPDGTGWLWGPRAPLSLTTDGGRTWDPLSVADGDVRIVAGANLYGPKKGGALIWDPGRQATLLLETTDGGSTWDEIYAFPQGIQASADRISARVW